MFEKNLYVSYTMIWRGFLEVNRAYVAFFGTLAGCSSAGAVQAGGDGPPLSGTASPAYLADYCVPVSTVVRENRTVLKLLKLANSRTTYIQEIPPP